MPARTNGRREMSERQQRDPSNIRQAFEHEQNTLDDTLAYLRHYARRNPERAALWCLGIGFVLGWKLKPW
jgi:hypothetical protein